MVLVEACFGYHMRQVLVQTCAMRTVSIQEALRPSLIAVVTQIDLCSPLRYASNDLTGLSLRCAASTSPPRYGDWRMRREPVKCCETHALDGFVVRFLLGTIFLTLMFAC